MSVRVAPPSVARGVGAKHTQRYEALKRELEEFCEKGPQVRILEVQSRGGGRPPPPPRARPPPGAPASPPPFFFFLPAGGGGAPPPPPPGGDVPRSCARARQRAG